MESIGIKILKVWFDEDVLEFEIEVSDGVSVFTNKAYVDHDSLAKTVEDLEVFREQVHGGIIDLKLGEFGKEYASGALSARLHFKSPGKLFVKTHSESEFIRLHDEEIASTSFMFFRVEISCLDNFVRELKSLSEKNRDSAFLEGEKIE